MNETKQNENPIKIPTKNILDFENNTNLTIKYFLQFANINYRLKVHRKIGYKDYVESSSMNNESKLGTKVYTCDQNVWKGEQRNLCKSILINMEFLGLPESRVRPYLKGQKQTKKM